MVEEKILSEIYASKIQVEKINSLAVLSPSASFKYF